MKGIEQNHLKLQREATLASAGASCSLSTFRRSRQPTPTTRRDLFRDGAAFFERLASAKSLEEAVEVRTEYTKTAYETFVAESKRIVETYNELFRNTIRPFGSMIEETPSEATAK